MVLLLLSLGVIVSSLEGKPDPGQKTVKGCECDSECGYDLIFGAYDWCYTKNQCGSFSLTRLSYYDYCIYPENATYQGQTATAKLQKLWNSVTKNTTSGTFPSIAGVFVESVKTSFENINDVMPAERLKYVHSVGWVAQAIFTPAADTPYSGIFKSGSKSALIRFSVAKDVESNPPLMVPGIAIKFLRDNLHSANIFAMPSLDGQASFNFFALNFTNHPKTPSGWALQILGKKFSEASACPVMVGVSDIAAYEETGKKVTPVFPFEVVYVPTGKVNFPTAFADLKKIGEYFSQVAIGTPVFNVYAFDTPAARKGKARLIGTVTTTTRVVSSYFGDSSLFFEHQYIENDLKIHPEWINQIDPATDCANGKPGPEPPNPPPTL